MLTKPKGKRAAREVPQRIPEVLDVRMAAALLAVSADTVYKLFS